MKIIKSLLWCLCGICFLVFHPVLIYGQVAQEIGFSSSPNPVGSGSRALGMGGAFIGVADDATAASWNPGGLIQLETPEISMVVSYENRSEERTFSENPEASGTYNIELADLNYLSAAYPFTLYDKNMIVSLNYQTLYDFNKKVEANYQYSQPFPGPSGARSTTKETSGTLKALSPAFAVQITPTVSAGLTLNWFSKNMGNTWKTTYTDSLAGTFAGFPYSRDVFYEDEYQFEGVNFNFGMLWSINQFLTLGAVYKTQFDADVHYREAYSVSATNQNTPYTVVADEDQTIRMPASYGAGLACRFSDQFTMDLDMYRTDWQNYTITQANGQEISPITGQSIETVNTEPTHQIRLGGEYLFLNEPYVIPLRAGVFYDPEPTAENPDDFYGLSIGSGVARGKVVFDAAYQYRWGNDVREVRLGQEVVTQDVQQHTIYMSLIYHF